MDKKYLLRLQKIELEILVVVSEICEKHDIIYCLQGGTLLGALRHNGFIPWDDDIDITMPRKDFEKFIDVCKMELPNDYYLQTYRTDGINYKPYAKVRKNGTVFLENNNDKAVGNNGIFIDIFPLDSTKKENGKNVKVKNGMLRIVNNILMIKAGLHRRNIIKSGISALLPMKFLQYYQQFLMKSVGDESDPYFVSMGGTLDVVKQTFPKETYYPVKKHKFEQYEFNIPSDADYYLSRVYGKYMELPPEDKRHTHDPYKIEFNDGEEDYYV